MTIPNSFPFDIEKAIQAIGVLHSAEDDAKVAYYRLLKFLYISDREYLKETGRPIVGGRDVAMNKGPLSSSVYDLIKGQHQDSCRFFEFFHRQNRLLQVKKDPGRDDLSKREIRKLVEVSERYRDFDDDDVGALAHQFEEYKACFVRDTSTTIPLSKKIEAMGIFDKSDSIQKDIQQMIAWKQLIGSGR